LPYSSFVRVLSIPIVLNSFSDSVPWNRFKSYAAYPSPNILSEPYCGKFVLFLETIPLITGWFRILCGVWKYYNNVLSAGSEMTEVLISSRQSPPYLSFYFHKLHGFFSLQLSYFYVVHYCWLCRQWKFKIFRTKT
jgi:hypothetical protein